MDDKGKIRKWLELEFSTKFYRVAHFPRESEELGKPGYLEHRNKVLLYKTLFFLLCAIVTGLDHGDLIGMGTLHFLSIGMFRPNHF